MLRFFPVLLLAPTVLALSTCADTEAVEETEHPSVVITQWNDSTELFLEYPHLLVGEATGNWAIHLTDMTTFRPITEGTLTVEFHQGAQVAADFTLDAPARDGIFLLDPVMEGAGTYEVRLILRSPQVDSEHVLPQVVVWQSAEELPQDDGEEEGGIAFLKEQQWQIPFQVAAAQEREVRRSLTAPGEIIAPDGALVLVSAPVSGIAPAAANRAAPSMGQAVRAGDVLAILTPSAEAGGYARIVGELERLEREAARAERLFAVGAIPEKRRVEAQHDLEVARAEMEAVGGGAEGDEYRLVLRAPISGVVAERTFSPGGRVEAGEPLFTIVDPRTVWLRVQLPPGAAASVGAAAPVSFTAEGLDSAFETSALISVGSVLESATRTVPSIFSVQNPDGALKVGQFASAVVPVGGGVLGVAVPLEAIIDDNGTSVAYVQISGETFQRRILLLGESDAAYAQVLQGIEPGEMVVTEGAYQVRLASMSGNEFAGAHAH